MCSVAVWLGDFVKGCFAVRVIIRDPNHAKCDERCKPVYPAATVKVPNARGVPSRRSYSMMRQLRPLCAIALERLLRRDLGWTVFHQRC